MINCIERNISVLSDLSCVMQPIEYVQYTNAISILFHLVDYTIPEGSTARVYVEWPSTKGEYDTATIEGNDIRIKVKDTMFSEVGKCFLQLYIVNGEDTLVTFRYPIAVKKNHVPGITKPSENQSDFLEEYLAEIDNKIETTGQQLKATEQALVEASTYAENAEKSAQNAAQSEKNSASNAGASKMSEDNALAYQNAAASSAAAAEQSNKEAGQSADNAAIFAEQAAESERNALSYAESAKIDAEQINGRIDLAVESAECALQSEKNAEAKSIIADEKAILAEQYTMMAESFTHGGTGARENESVDNAQYYLEQAKQISQSMNGLIPMGTITAEELSLEENKVNKYMFNISNDFVTDDTFKEGAGHSYPAGVNVFRTNDGYWDCLAGSFQTPNGDTKDNVTAFVQASTRANIASGEKHSIIFGKIAKWFADLKTVAFSGSYNDLSDKPSAGDVGAVATGGSVADNIVNGYTEATELTEIAIGEKVSESFSKIKLAVKNVISIIKLLGSTDISKIEDGTVTGILSALNTKTSSLDGDMQNKAYISNVLHIYKTLSNSTGGFANFLGASGTYLVQCSDYFGDKCWVGIISVEYNITYQNTELHSRGIKLAAMNSAGTLSFSDSPNDYYVKAYRLA